MFVHWLSCAPFLPPQALLFAELQESQYANKDKNYRRQRTLEEVRRPLAHSRVDERLGGLDVVVEVVTEGLNV